MFIILTLLIGEKASYSHLTFLVPVPVFMNTPHICLFLVSLTFVGRARTSALLTCCWPLSPCPALGTQEIVLCPLHCSCSLLWVSRPPDQLHTNKADGPENACPALVFRRSAPTSFPKTSCQLLSDTSSSALVGSHQGSIHVVHFIKSFH